MLYQMIRFNHEKFTLSSGCLVCNFWFLQHLGSLQYWIQMPECPINKTHLFCLLNQAFIILHHITTYYNHITMTALTTDKHTNMNEGCACDDIPSVTQVSLLSHMSTSADLKWCHISVSGTPSWHCWVKHCICWKVLLHSEYEIQATSMTFHHWCNVTEIWWHAARNQYETKQ